MNFFFFTHSFHECLCAPAYLTVLWIELKLDLVASIFTTELSCHLLRWGLTVAQSRLEFAVILTLSSLVVIFQLCKYWGYRTLCSLNWLDIYSLCILIGPLTTSFCLRSLLSVVKQVCATIPLSVVFGIYF